MVNLDMDGTFYNLYGIEEWLPALRTESKDIFTKGNALYDLEELKKALEKAKKKEKLGIITWAPKQARLTYIMNCAKQKREWLKKTGLDKYFTRVIVRRYGFPKWLDMLKGDTLIDDDKNNIKECRKHYRKGIYTNGKDLLKILENI